MTEMNKINAEALENVAGGKYENRTVHNDAVNYANIRKEPGLSSEVFFTAKNGQQVTITGNKVKKDGYVITNLRAVKPTTATLLGSTYGGSEMIGYLKSVIPEDHLLIVDGTKAIAELGNPRCLNVVLLGAAVRTGALGLTEADILEAMPKVIKPKFLELNTQAFKYAG